MIVIHVRMMKLVMIFQKSENLYQSFRKKKIQGKDKSLIIKYRISVSAEAYGKFCKKEEFVPKVVPKTEA